MTPPDACVLVTNYNNAPWLRACLDSVLAQTLAPAEIVVYDDGSNDESLSILRSYGDRLRLLAGERGAARPAVARQAAGLHAALRASRAPHVHLLDADDAWLPRRIEAYETAWAAAPEALLVQAPMTFIDEHGRPGSTLRHPRLHRGETPLALIRRTHDPQQFYLSSALAFRRDLLEKAFPSDYDDGLLVAIDFRLAFEAVLRGPVLTLDKSLSLYRVRAGSIADQSGMRAGPRWRTTEHNHACFNHAARRLGLPPARLWRNHAWLRQRARGLLPAALGARLASLLAPASRR